MATEEKTAPRRSVRKPFVIVEAFFSIGNRDVRDVAVLTEER
jgi:hypothetical protein